MDWVRGKRIGQGSFATVNLAIPRSQSCPKMMAVKSCGVAHSASLMNEKSILDQLKGCPQIISSFGDCFTTESGEKLYNVLLDYASGGSLADKIKNSDDQRLHECEVRRYTKGILKGLRFIQMNGYVHCDIKPQNILVDENGDIKIADFGLAKKQSKLGCELKGTPMYMSPEMVTGGEQGCASDIWALGCVVVEMMTGASPWRCSDMASLVMKIGVGEEVPGVPREISNEGKDFLEKCFVKDPKKRWTAEMLLNHAFVNLETAREYGKSTSTNAEKSHDLPSTSPKCPFDFPYSNMSSPSSADGFDFSWGGEGSSSASAADRLEGLLCDQIHPDWSLEDHWVTVR